MSARGARNSIKGNTRSLQHQRTVGFNKLKDWANPGHDPDELIMEIIINLDEIKSLLSQRLNRDKLQLLADILDTALKAKHHELCFGRFLETLMATNFFTVNITLYLNSNANVLKHRLANAALIYIQEAASLIPDRMEHCNQLVTFLCKNYYSLNCDVNAVIKMRDSFQDRIRAKSLAHSLAQQREHDSVDFRNIPTLPSHWDIKPDRKPLLREIKVIGQYRDRHEYLDIMFRLMREDLVQPLREAIRQARVGDESNLILLENVRIVGVEIKDGIVHLIQLDISKLKNFKTLIKNNFLTGNLVCVSPNNFHSVMFATYANNTDQELSIGIVRLNFINCLQDVFSLSPNTCLNLIESPSFYEAYSHVLEGLKSWRDVPLPLESYLVSCKRNPDNPAYLYHGSVYDISCLMQDEVYYNIQCRVLSTDSWPSLHRSCLNSKQLEAVKEALTKELTLIQGPPGTGKTFVSLKIMRTLLKNVSVSSPNDGPILVVCYTNHALDQFLEGILKFCNKGIIRVGGNSKCDALEKYNLTEVRKNDKARCARLNRALYNIYREIDPIKNDIKKLIDKLNLANEKVLDIQVLGDFMTENHRHSFSGHFTGDYSGSIMNTWLTMDDTDFESYLKGATETKAISSKRRISYGQALGKIEISSIASSEEERETTNIWTLGVSARFRLYKCWHNRYVKTLSEQIKVLNQKYLDLVEIKNELHRMCDISILRQAKVVGMTTTGAAKHRKVLEAVGPRIVVVEEAAEVQEAHIITALSRKCQHLILIGDHKQLRPKVQVYELAQHYHLDVSLFERLVENNFNCIQLEEQFRMRPEISIFMRHIYPDLKDGESVKSRPSIAGMDKCVFFIKHNKPEEKIKQGTSKLNTFESKYLLKLSEYLLSQGHKSSHITILAAYGGQVTSIKDLLSTSRNSEIKDIRVSTIDDYQGEENRIILLSLVRSNSENQVGFLSTDNRVCVALSRAQFGMYVIGDIDLLSRRSQLWRNIKTTAEKQNCIGHTLRLSCQQHHRVTEIVKVADFDQAIQRKGCGLPCKTKLSCGHLCPRICHIGNHDNYVCREKCLRLCYRGHGCSERCNEPCPPCMTIVPLTLRCGHVQEQPCSVNTRFLICHEKCMKMCSEGHLCPEDCKVRCPPCQVIVERHLSCGHVLSVPCHTKNLVCVEKCQRKCPNGHTCLLLCKETCRPCSIYFTQTLPCGHTLGELCWKFTSGLAKCVEPCPNICMRGHECPKLCHEVCRPCRAKLPCGHLCLAKPHRLDLDNLEVTPCTRQCLNFCRNGHRCPNKCIEACPSNCAVVLKCGHQCRRKFDTPLLFLESPLEVCDEPCEKICDRGHKCFLNCSTACHLCEEVLTCGHLCASEPKLYTEPDASKPCLQQCKKVCSRGHQCPLKCHEICLPSCGHVKCKIIGAFSLIWTGIQNFPVWGDN